MPKRSTVIKKRNEIKDNLYINICFFILNNNFKQDYIQGNWQSNNLFKIKTENQRGELSKVSRLSMIYYPNSKCIDYKETVIEIKENGMFTIKHESTSHGFDIHRGRLNNYGIEKFKKLTLNSLVHKYPKHEFSNPRKFIPTNEIIFF